MASELVGIANVLSALLCERESLLRSADFGDTKTNFSLIRGDLEAKSPLFFVRLLFGLSTMLRGKLIS